MVLHYNHDARRPVLPSYLCSPPPVTPQASPQRPKRPPIQLSMPPVGRAFSWFPPSLGSAALSAQTTINLLLPKPIASPAHAAPCASDKFTGATFHEKPRAGH